MPWTMIAVSIGAQVFNNLQANKKNDELQKRQREFQKAAQLKEFDRMCRLQRESEQLQLEIDAEVHKQKIEDIKANYDEAIKKIAKDIAIKKWPLKVLPFVMRGQSFGTLFNGRQSIALHCILTPSNCNNFNEAIYTELDMKLETSINEHWSVLTSHPVAYYGGSWRRDPFNLDHVELLRTQLKHVPTVVITPYFNPKLCFKVRVWGEGKEADVRIEIPDGIFSYEYEKGMSYTPKDERPKGDLVDRTIEEFLIYLESLIGYVANIYFWKSYKVQPYFPNSITSPDFVAKEILTLYHSLYVKNFARMVSGVSQSNSINKFGQVKQLIPYVDGISCLEKSVASECIAELNKVISNICTNVNVATNIDISNALELSAYNASNQYDNEALTTFINKQSKITEHEYETVKLQSTDFSEINKFVYERLKDSVKPTYFYLCVWNSQIVIGRYGQDNFQESVYLAGNKQRYFIFIKDSVIDISQGNTQYYKIEIQTQKLIKMEKKNFEERFGNEFAKIGKSLGRIIDSVGGDKKAQSSSASVWNEENNTSSNNYEAKLINYFTQRVNDRTVDAVMDNNLTMQTFLDWIDAHYSPFATKAYIIKGFVEERKKYLFCIFLASDETAYIGTSDPAKCFVSNEVNSEMAQIFANNNICEIPFK